MTPPAAAVDVGAPSTGETEPSGPTTDGPAPVDAQPPDADGHDPVAGPGDGIGLGVLVGAVAGIWGLVIGLERLYDNSFLTHLATGRLILDQRSVPTTDPYSFTAGGEPWLVPSWLASVVYAGAEQVGGLGGVRVVNGLLCAALGVAVWLLTARSRSLVVRVGVTAAVLVPAGQLWSGRPLLFGLLGLAAVLLAADGRMDPRWLVPVCWVWANTHGSYPFALLALGLLAVGRRMDEGSWGPEVRALGWAVVGLAAGAINPLGPRILAYPLMLGSRTEAFQGIAEWKAPTYDSLDQYWVVGLLFVGVVALVRAPRWRSALPLVVFGALAVTSARNLAPLLVVLAPILAGAVPRFGLAVGDVRRPSFRVGLVALVAGGVALTAVSLRTPHTALDAYPEEAVAWMEDEGLWTSSSRVVAPDYVGNYRAARAGADANVFFDDRVDMYPLDVITDYRVLLDAAPGWAEVLDRRDASAVLWDGETPLGGALEASEDWSIVHRDAPWVVAVPSPAP